MDNQALAQTSLNNKTTNSPNQHNLSQSSLDIQDLSKQDFDLPKDNLHKPLDPIELQLNPLAGVADNLLLAWQSVLANTKHGYLSLTDSLFDELLIQVKEKQINDALYRFVTQNVQMVHDLHLDLHDNWLRLYATIYTSGVYASVATNLRLVGAEISPNIQRLIFEQISKTDILDLHSKKWWQASAAKFGVAAYRKITGNDPLPFLLQKIKVKDEPFAVHKGEYIYLDISRYFAGKTHITNYFKKAQVNDATTKEANLLLKLQINFGELISFGEAGEDIITEKDNPNRQKT